MKAPTAPLIALAALLGVTAVHAQTPPAADATGRAASREVQDAEPAVTAPRDTSSAAQPAPATRAPAPAVPVTPNADRSKAPERTGKAQDRLELETTQITGNRELPKVMVVVPWKRSDIGDLAGRPVNSLVDEVLQPVDRAELRREIDYYSALSPDHPRDETRVTGGNAKERPEK